MTQEEFFKRYKFDVVDDRIGGGGFGTVYKAYDTTLHREVAIKVSEVKVVNGKTFSLRDEVEALTHVPEHPNIANYEKDKLFTFKMPNGVYDYAVMQYYPDGNLNNAIKHGLTAKQKEDVAKQLLEGIAFLHQHKVVHRDLKPGNILVVRDGDRIIPIITDFGLSKAANLGDGSVFTNSLGAGTPRYSSPEQLQGNPLRLNTDLWSYGSILYEIFTGEQLFSASSGAANTAQADMEIYNKIVSGDVRSLGGMPEKWRKVAERCLVVDAEKRAKDASELFCYISGEAQEDETVANAGGSGGLPPFKGVPEGRGIESPQSPMHSGKSSQPDDEGTVLTNQPQPKEKQQPVASASTPSTGSGTSSEQPKSKKTLWIALTAVIIGAVAAVLLLRQPSLTGFSQGHEYVDLGLPSGTLWATCNVGASRPEDYGNYYAWGETSTKSTYDWNTYRYANGDFDKLTKYCNKSNYGDNGFTDNLTELQSGDDPAAANWGNGWQTPSMDQCVELLNYTDFEWTTQNGVNGWQFTSRMNGQTLFLPAAGRCDSAFYDVGSSGWYWSRSLLTDTPDGAWYFVFDSDDWFVGNDRTRINNFSVRPVREN